MKVRNYEKKALIYVLLGILLILEIIIIYIFCINKIYEYEVVSGIVIKDDLVVLIITDKTKKNISKSNSFYLNNKKVKYRIIEDRGYILKKNKEKYSELLVSFKFDNEYKVNDNLQLMFKKEKIKIIEIFKIIWEGD